MNSLETRIAAVRKSIADNGIDTLMVLMEENRRYLSGFTAEDHQFDESAGALLINENRLILTTDSRFELQAKREAPLFEIQIYQKGLAKELSTLAERMNSARIGIESARVTVKQYNEFLKELQTAQSVVELVPMEEMVESLRLVKTPQEVERTRKALFLAEEAFLEVARTLKPGMTEKELAWSMEKVMREKGADGLSFPVIVAAGPNSALPHAIPTDRPINSGEPILFDWGARLNGYCSDTTRTVLIGQPDETFHKVYHTVLQAQQKAIAAIKDGISSKEVDRVARDYIHGQGFEGKFGHGLGHGTGLAVHEGPRLSPLKDTVLRSGMIVTVEPGIYLPEWGGIRIENQVVVGSEGPQVLNRLSETFDIQLLEL